VTVTRDDFLAAFRSVLDHVDPERAAADAVRTSNGAVVVGDATFDGFEGVPVVVALGKAACAMARGVSSVVGPVRGIAVSDHEEPAPVEVIVGGHPIPDERSLEAGRRMLDVVRSVGPDEFVIFCISGGGSAVAEVPAGGVGLDDVAALNTALIAGGLPIEEINEVRASISDIKGGRLARACRSKHRVTLVLSDVVGAGPEAVASGPTLGFGLGEVSDEAMNQIRSTGGVPEPVADAIAGSVPVEATEPQRFVVLGSPVTSAGQAAAALTERGIEARLWTSSLSGDVEPAVMGMIERVEDARNSVAAVVATGEVTVRVAGSGVGGRNQHAAVLAAKAIRGTALVFGAFGTDGRDGPTDAAGAIVDGGSADRMRRNGIDIDEAIRTFDSHAALAASGDLVITGPTGTNVADVWMAGRTA
jgi:hydroxypyruvate reductase